MRLLHPFFTLTVLTALAALTACSPTFNWREVRVGDTNLIALLPCKPDQGMRSIEMGHAKVDLHMQGCEAGPGAGKMMFTVATFTAPPSALSDKAPLLLGAWQAAALVSLHANESKVTLAPVFKELLATKVIAFGQRSNGSRIESQALYFAQGTQQFQVMVLADKISPEVAEAFFTGLKRL
jgi:hypothetical protein